VTRGPPKQLLMKMRRKAEVEIESEEDEEEEEEDEWDEDDEEEEEDYDREETMARMEMAPAEQEYGGIGALQAELALRAHVTQVQLYQPMSKTEEFAETHYWKVKLEDFGVNSQLIPMNEYWSDLAQHLASDHAESPFVSKHIGYCTANLNSTLAALAVCGLPLRGAEPPDMKIESGELKYTARSSPVVLYHKVRWLVRWLVGWLIHMYHVCHVANVDSVGIMRWLCVLCHMELTTDDIRICTNFVSFCAFLCFDVYALSLYRTWSVVRSLTSARRWWVRTTSIRKTSTR